MSSDKELSILQEFRWSPQPLAGAWVAGISQTLRQQIPLAEKIRERLFAEAGVRFDDMIDTIAVGKKSRWLAEAKAAGCVRDGGEEGAEMYAHPGGVFPRIAADERAEDTVGIDLKVERVEDFLAAWQLHREIEGEAGERWRRAGLEEKSGAALGVVVRLGWEGTRTQQGRLDPSTVERVALDFHQRRRDFENPVEGFAQTETAIDAAIAAVGREAACQLFFAAERDYWMTRNRAARAQYQRQQRLGIGWANHDHHTYRSSRIYFSRLVGLWEKLGLVCRERFYAGREAGWGAQVMESAATGIVAFNDVDLSAEELLADFAHQPLAAKNVLGTVGLWCGLHGEAVLQAGMHHLEAQFAFDALREQLAADAGIVTMKPFTDFPHLRQAFTEGERWKVPEKNIDRLLSQQLITAEQAERFASQGAIGSHLENLERNDGFKGFNQSGVSEIITATDPRKHLANGPAR